MPKIILIAAFILITTLDSASEQFDLHELKDWKIITAPEATAAEMYAAQEFQRDIKLCAGFEISIVTDGTKADKAVYIGTGPWINEEKNKPDISALGEEGLYIGIHNKRIVIAGGKPRGTLYGVYEFAEKYLGMRFLTFDHTYIPPKTRWKIPCEEYTFIPPFSFRWSYYGENSEHPEFSSKLRVNTTTPAEKLGGETKQGLITHTLLDYLPVKKYGKEHPEYFAMVNGKRDLQAGRGEPQPCVTNPEVIEIIANAVLAELDKNPDRQNISVSQNDNDDYCRCEKCEAINQQEGTPMGSHLAFVNAVAERIEKKYPKVKVGTLAYWYTRKPPKTIKPRDNVQIQLCSIECCTFHAIDDPKCEKNKAFCQDMNAWGKICHDIWVWNYNTNFAFMDLPFPNLRSISKNVQYFQRNNTRGLFMQCTGGGSHSGELCDLRNYVISHCLWNPSLDSWTIAEEFCRLHYGKSANTIIRYLHYLHEQADKTGCHPACFPDPYELGINSKTAEKIFDFFTKALKEAENEEVRNRVEKASICSLRAVLETCGIQTIQNGTLRILYPEKYGNIVEQYMMLTKKHLQNHAEEWQPIEHYYGLLEQYAKTGFRAERLENKTWRVTVLPGENGKIIELFYKPEHRELLSPHDYCCLRKLFTIAVCEEKRIDDQGLNDSSVFTVQKSADEMVLSKKMAAGSLLTRKITLQDAVPDTIFFETTITSNTDEPQEYRFRIQPEFFTDQVLSVNHYIKSYYKEKTWIPWNLDEPVKGSFTLERNAPAGGEVLFFNHHKNFGVKETFDPDKTAEVTYHLNKRFPLDKRYPFADLYLDTQKFVIKRGECFRYSYQLGYVRHQP